MNVSHARLSPCRSKPLLKPQACLSFPWMNDTRCFILKVMRLSQPHNSGSPWLENTEDSLTLEPMEMFFSSLSDLLFHGLSLVGRCSGLWCCGGLSFRRELVYSSGWGAFESFVLAHRSGIFQQLCCSFGRKTSVLGEGSLDLQL